jgi:hypothetical protein
MGYITYRCVVYTYTRLGCFSVFEFLFTRTHSILGKVYAGNTGTLHVMLVGVSFITQRNKQYAVSLQNRSCQICNVLYAFCL